MGFSRRQPRGAAVVFRREGSDAFDFKSPTRYLDAISHEGEFGKAVAPQWCVWREGINQQCFLGGELSGERNSSFSFQEPPWPPVLGAFRVFEVLIL